MAYFDNAATTYPKPEVVYDYMNQAYRNIGGNSGRGSYVQSKSASQLITNTREEIKDLLHCRVKQVIFESSATISLNIILQGLFSRGVKSVYISPYEHNAVTRVLNYYQQKGSIKVNILATNGIFFDELKIRSQFETEKPDLVIISHVSNVIGIINPVEAIFEISKKYDAVNVVDMAQSAGLIDLNIGLETIDFAVFAGHKTLYGPTGISGFVMKSDFDLPSILFGGTGFESANQNMPNNLPEKFEFGTQNILGIAGLNASLRWIKSIGINELYKKEVENRIKLLKLIQNYSFIKLIGIEKNAEYTGIISCLIDGISSDSAGSVFSKLNIAVRTGLHCAPLAHKHLNTFPTGTIRLSVSYFTSDKDFEALEEALEYIGENL